MTDTRTLTQLIQQAGDLVLYDGKAAKVHLAIEIWKQALAGEMRAIQMVYDRLEGKVPTAEPQVQPQETLSEDLERAIDKVYGDSEGGGLPEGTGS